MKRLFASVLLAMALLLGMTPTAFAASAFTDVPDTHWASSYIQRAYEKGWGNGMSQTIYAPSDSLTRAQFLKMMATAFYSADLQTAEGANAGAWYAPSWTVAQKSGLEKGTNMTRLSDLTAQISRYDEPQYAETSDARYPTALCTPDTDAPGAGGGGGAAGECGTGQGGAPRPGYV